MVFFTCSDCNQTIKKNKVDQHFAGRCRNAEYVSCVDCSADFYGNEYITHTSCISEAEKYGGKGFKQAANVNKGQKKQQLWVDKVQQAIDKALSQSSDPKLTELLEYIKTATNLPQKKPKFINFLKSTFPRYRTMDKLFERIWTILEEVKIELKNSQSVEANNDTCKTAPASDTAAPASDTAAPASDMAAPAKERQHKRKRGVAGLAGEESLKDEEVEAIREKKRSKREAKSHPEQENVERLNDTLEVEEKTTKDFNWEAMISRVLQKGEISLKKLRKKAVSEFLACGKFMRSEERVWRKLDKKLQAMPSVQVNNDKVTLVGT